MLNVMTYDQFVPKPWGRYTDVPDGVRTWFALSDSQRLYLPTPYDSYWYLGERFSSQTRGDEPIVPLDPPPVLFVQTPDPAVRVQHLEGMSDDLLIREADYRVFVMRLAPARIDPPDFPTEVEYEYEGARHTVSLPEVHTMVSDFGMESWSSHVVKETFIGGYGRRPTDGGSWRRVGLVSCVCAGRSPRGSGGSVTSLSGRYLSVIDGSRSASGSSRSIVVLIRSLLHSLYLNQWMLFRI
ncbi:hypothetical protein RND81_01G094600 [Saponaria officinalis]|uniref:Uncharacterized protein n=1 Tax=Saponaria officinalis TaxID=3572 RepID=A0AAW1N9A7_SAPOF